MILRTSQRAGNIQDTPLKHPQKLLRKEGRKGKEGVRRKENPDSLSEPDLPAVCIPSDAAEVHLIHSIPHVVCLHIE